MGSLLNYFFSSNEGLASMEFGWKSANFVLKTRTTSGETLTLVTSAGTKDTFTGTISKTFPDDSERQGQLTISAIPNLDIIEMPSGVTYINGDNGIADLSVFTGIVRTTINDSYCWKFTCQGVAGISLNNTNAMGNVVDISKITNANDVRGSFSNLTGFIFPINNNTTNTIVLSFTPINPLNFTITPIAMSQLELLQLSSKGLYTIDISGSSNLSYLSVRNTNNTNIITSPGAALQTVDFIFNNYTAASYNNGNPNSLASLVTNSSKLANFYLYKCGLSESEETLIIDALYNSLPYRNTNCFIDLNYDQGTYSYWPQHGLRGEMAPNDSIVRQVTRNKIAAIRAAGHTINIPTPVFSGTVISANEIEVTYYGEQNIDSWNIGDTLVCSFSQGYFPTGNYTVLSGSNKVWRVQPPSALQNGNSPFTENLLLDKQ